MLHLLTPLCTVENVQAQVSAKILLAKPHYLHDESEGGDKRNWEHWVGVRFWVYDIWHVLSNYVQLVMSL